MEIVVVQIVVTSGVEGWVGKKISTSMKKDFFQNSRNLSDDGIIEVIKSVYSPSIPALEIPDMPSHLGNLTFQKIHNL